MVLYASPPRDPGAVALVTGSTSGLGREPDASRGDGTHVIVHGRDQSGHGGRRRDRARGRTARFYQADFGSFAQVRALGEAVLRDYTASTAHQQCGFGRAPNERMVTEDGHELRLQVNHLAHFLRPRMLLPTIIDSVPARIVNVLRAQNPLDFDNVMLERESMAAAPTGRASSADHVPFTCGGARRNGRARKCAAPRDVIDTRWYRGLHRPQSTVDEEPIRDDLVTGDVGSGGYFNQMRPARANAQAYDLGPAAAARAERGA